MYHPISVPRRTFVVISHVVLMEIGELPVTVNTIGDRERTLVIATVVGSGGGDVDLL